LRFLDEDVEQSRRLTGVGARRRSTVAVGRVWAMLRRPALAAIST
jgi:hypothetical protein